MLHLSSDHIQAIRNHAEQVYPEECCGLMLGQMGLTDEADAQVSKRAVVELWPVTNAWGEEAKESMVVVNGDTAEQSFTAERRYWIDPKDMLAAQKYGRSHQLQIIGIYHSHPDHPAVPSECDRACAWSDYSYIIVSVTNGQAADVLSWTLDSHHQFQSEVLKVEH